MEQISTSVISHLLLNIPYFNTDPKMLSWYLPHRHKEFVKLVFEVNHHQPYEKGHWPSVYVVSFNCNL